MHPIENKNKLQKRNAEIIEDASFYQDLTYIKLMEEIEKYANKGKSSFKISDRIGEKMKEYLNKKGFIIKDLNWGINGEWNRHDISW